MRRCGEAGDEGQGRVEIMAVHADIELAMRLAARCLAAPREREPIDEAGGRLDSQASRACRSSRRRGRRRRSRLRAIALDAQPHIAVERVGIRIEPRQQPAAQRGQRRLQGAQGPRGVVGSLRQAGVWPARSRSRAIGCSAPSLLRASSWPRTSGEEALDRSGRRTVAEPRQRALGRQAARRLQDRRRGRRQTLRRRADPRHGGAVRGRGSCRRLRRRAASGGARFPRSG